ncbi:MAG TPA: epoxyqueuosine reductase QueH [Candidatus Dojkabacteria bacterium]|nr:epoxyqueuosine reductase QueH [Candidatus Dojkabacteria bacterium]HQI92478.1 epoxyqueuosine reductase QueH [Candidatus Dojkabacteria bacterium]
MEKSILIHTCCADCLLNTLSSLETQKNLTVLFYNPNIHPRAEFLERLNAVKIVLMDYPNIKLVIPDYRPSEYFESIKKEEKRCTGCWKQRLGYLFKYAKEHEFDSVTSTLISSSYQNKGEILKIASDLEKEFSIPFILPKEYKQEIHKGFYKQNFCGCCYSLTERMNEKYVK